MEHDDMDKKFRDFIQNDKSELNEVERNSKETIWGKLDLPQKERRVFPFWKIAAAVLLLLLGGTTWVFTDKINEQGEHFAELEKELLETKNSLQMVQQEFAQLESTNSAETENNILPKVNQPKEVVENLRKEYVENVVYLRDTVFLEKKILLNQSAEKLQEKIQLVRDTVFIEVPAKQPAQFVDLEPEEESLKGKKSKKKKKSRKMEFVFGKKPLKKPSKKNPLVLINDSELAKSTTRDNRSNVLTIPISKN